MQLNNNDVEICEVDCSDRLAFIACVHACSADSLPVEISIFNFIRQSSAVEHKKTIKSLIVAFYCTAAKTNSFLCRN